MEQRSKARLATRIQVTSVILLACSLFVTRVHNPILYNATMLTAVVLSAVAAVMMIVFRVPANDTEAHPDA